MNWTDHKARLKRFLRDPNNNIWSDAFILRSFNDCQKSLQHKTGIIEKVTAIKVPPEYGTSYMYDWEYTYAGTDGKPYQCLRHFQQSNIVHTYNLEAQVLSGLTPTESDSGTHFTHPWEAWYCNNEPGDLVPIWLPIDYHKTKFIAWDEEPIPYIPIKDIQNNDASWRTRAGAVIGYYKLDDMSREIYLYPLPSSPVFEDPAGDIEGGMAMFVEDDEEAAQEYGVVIDREGTFITGDYGIAIDIIDQQNNILLVYEALPTDIEDDEDVSDLPGFLTKYVEFDVLERSYAANTDGQIESLRDYWGWRRDLGLETVKAFKRRKRADRDYQLTTKTAPCAMGNRKRPRLPDYYPITV